MTDSDIDEVPLRRYLLGELPAEEGRRLEELLLTDAEYFERLTLVEDELIDEYARGSLSDDERERFGAFFRSDPERRWKLDVVQTLKSYATSDLNSTDVETAKPVEPARQSVSRWAALAAALGIRSPALAFSLAALLLVPGVGWFVYRQWRAEEQPSVATRIPEETPPSQASPSPQATAPKTQDAPPTVGPERPHNSSTPRAQDTPAPPREAPPNRRANDNTPARSRVFAMTLSAPLVRDERQGKSFTVPQTARRVRLTIELESDDYKRYRASVRNIDTGEQTAHQSLTAGAGRRRVVLDLPARNLKPGDYILSLSGVADGGATVDIRSYYFRIAGP